jgi:DNA-binding beta-propeller fold protein YncE
MFRLNQFLFLLIFASTVCADQLLPNGLNLAPAGNTFDVGNMPLSGLISPEGKLILLLSGFREQGVQVVDPVSQKVTQTLLQDGAFLGIAFSRDGKTLYASGANGNVIHVYKWKDSAAELSGSILLDPPDQKKKIARYPAGIAVSPDGRYLFVAENCTDTLAAIDLQSNTVVDRKPAGHYPYTVVSASDGTLYVSAWGGNGITRFKTDPHTGMLQQSDSLVVLRHPSTLLLNSKGNRLFVVSGSTDKIGIIDTGSFRLIRTLRDLPPLSPEGSSPNAIALSRDGSKLYVAEGMNNAVAVFQLSSESAGIPQTAKQDQLLGRIPVGWYPTAILAGKNGLYIINGKGRGTRANPKASQGLAYAKTPTEYTLGQLNGTITKLPYQFSPDELQKHSQHVADLNRWKGTPQKVQLPPFRHVLYIIKENRTYDQVFGDVSQGDGDPSLVFFPQTCSPNHRAIAERFGLFDRFFVNAEVSAQGHPWSTSAYVTDFTEKTVQSAYSSRRDAEADEDDVADPATGYLWDLAKRAKISLRVYGEYAKLGPDQKTYQSTKAGASAYTSPTYPSYDLNIPDQERANAWLKEFQGFIKTGSMPALQIFHLPNDHTAAAKAGLGTPQAMFADNDLALARIIEALSNSIFWKDTIVFVVEDDSQSGPDHVDSHRSVLLIASAYSKRGTIHRFVNTTDVIATIEQILKLGSLSQFDFYGKPLHEIFSSKPDLTPYKALIPEQSLQEKNPEGANARKSDSLRLEKEDLSDDDLFNRILWVAIKGTEIPFPEQKTVSMLQLQQEQ